MASGMTLDPSATAERSLSAATKKLPSPSPTSNSTSTGPNGGGGGGIVGAVGGGTGASSTSASGPAMLLGTTTAGGIVGAAARGAYGVEDLGGSAADPERSSESPVPPHHQAAPVSAPSPTSSGGCGSRAGVYGGASTPVAAAQTDVTYLRQHSVHVLLDSMVREILAEKPADSHHWMLRWFHEKHRLRCEERYRLNSPQHRPNPSDSVPDLPALVGGPMPESTLSTANGGGVHSIGFPRDPPPPFADLADA